MGRRTRTVFEALSEAAETASGWAIAALLFYALVFVDLTGGGSLYSALRGLADPQLKTPGFQIVVPAAPERKRDGDRILVESPETGKPAETPADPARNSETPAAPRPAAALTDSLADPRASQGREWRAKLKPESRLMVYYGRGDEPSVTSAPAAETGAAPAISPLKPFFAATPRSAAAKPAASRARPGVSSRVVSRSVPADGVRNFRAKP